MHIIYIRQHVNFNIITNTYMYGRTPPAFDTFTTISECVGINGSDQLSQPIICKGEREMKRGKDGKGERQGRDPKEGIVKGGRDPKRKKKKVTKE